MTVTVPLDPPRQTVDLGAQRAVVRWAWASLAANLAIVVTGGLVRLTGSGLGCPTWPQCTTESYVPHEALGFHAVIEFGNRMVGLLVAAIAIATWIVVKRRGRSDLFRVATIAALGVPLQAGIGGITVLTGLNPWIVSLHFLISLVMIAATATMVRRAGGRAAEEVSLVGLGLVRMCFLAVWIVVALGTVVTGSGPHAGDESAGRTGLDAAAVSHLHADAVFVLFGLTLSLVLVTRLAVATPVLRRLVGWVLAVELVQGSVGFVQYLTGLPWVLVLFHLFFAAVLVALVSVVFEATRRSEVRR